MAPITLQDIADFLMNKESSRKVLFLGAKAGGFFENEGLYAMMKLYSTETFDNLDSDQKFQRCYQVLERFSERDRDSALSQSLTTSRRYRLEDDYLAELIKSGFFDVVISTNIDLLLEDALRRERVRESREYQLLIYDGKTPAGELVRSPHNLVLKIFGDLESKYYKIAGDEFLIEEDEQLRDFLEGLLDNDVLMVGYHPDWDGPLDKAFFMKGGRLIYVNSTPLRADSFLARLIERRKGNYLTGEQGAYKSFMRGLHAQLFERGPLSYEAMQKVFGQLQQLQEDISLLRDDIQELQNELRSQEDTNSQEDTD
jgi:SIR2-like domain